uniref:Uncharacterized protein n=1 Tax=Sphaerodactylus townsendi TaxID=933632 RepID=A0ACB8FJC4_9SAUR
MREWKASRRWSRPLLFGSAVKLSQAQLAVPEKQRREVVQPSELRLRRPRITAAVAEEREDFESRILMMEPLCEFHVNKSQKDHQKFSCPA